MFPVHASAVLAGLAGLFKIFVGIAFVLTSMKAMVLMAWVLSIFKYAPDLWPAYSSHYGHVDRIANQATDKSNILSSMLNYFSSRN